MNIFTNIGFKILLIFLSLGNVFSYPIKHNAIDPWVPLLPDRLHFQIDRTVFVIPEKNTKTSQP
jgi:hypothetical protein